MGRDHSFELETLIRDYGNDVLRTAYLYVKDKATAEDIFQEVFLKVHKNITKFREESSIKTWLIRITINTCKDYLKSAYQKHNVLVSETYEKMTSQEEDFEQVEREETVHTLKKAVMQLPEEYKDIVLCVFYQEMSMKETSAFLKIPEGTVKSRLNRAKNRLKEMMEGRESL